jgi:hypothetical protein
VNSEALNQFNRDFKELLQMFAEHEVEYLVVGGYAVIHYTQPRYTKDLDLWIRPNRENAERVRQVFGKFGIPMIEVTPEDFADEGLQFMIGVEPSAIDFLTSLPGLDFAGAWSHRVTDGSLGFPVHFLGPEELIQAKQTAGRTRDIADIEEIHLARKAKKRP